MNEPTLTTADRDPADPSSEEPAAASSGASEAAPDWRDAITDEAARAFADSSHDINHLARRGVDMREKLSRAVFIPGKDAGPDEVAAFNRALGVPETAAAYRWPDPPEGQDLADDAKAVRAEWSQFFLENGFTRAQAEGAIAKLREMSGHLESARLAADRAFAAEQEAMLRAEWPGAEYDRNREMANRAARQLFGDDFTAVMALESSDGRLLMDHAAMARVFARIGHEMAEGGMSVPMADTGTGTVEAEIESLRKKQADANARGDTRLANRFYQEEMALIEKRDGSKGLVGADGRAH